MSIPFSRVYTAGVNVVPATLTADTVYVALNNPAASGVALKILDIYPQMSFAAAAANSRSFFALQKVAALATGGTALTPTHVIDPIADAKAVVLSSTTGLTITPGSTNRCFFFAQPSQPSAVGRARWQFSDENPFLIAPGSAMIMLAHVLVISGVAVSLSMRWAEE